MAKLDARKSLLAGTAFLAFAIGVLAVTDKAAGNPVVPGAVVGNFRHGTYPSLGDRTHVGVDLFAACSTPVYALDDGTVIDTIASEDDRNFDSLGYMVLIEQQDPGGPLTTLYLHLQNPPRVQVEDAVQAGTLIGEVGDTGFAPNGCYVHFEARNFLSRFHLEWKNIYGNGDQRETAAFRDDWENPENLFARSTGEAPDDGLTVAQMRRDYAQNSEQFEATYKNRILALQGSVNKVSLLHSENVKRLIESTDEAWFVGLASEAFPRRARDPSQAGADRMGALCIVVVAEAQPDLSSFEIGDPIAVSGRLLGFVDDVPMLHPCSVRRKLSNGGEQADPSS